MLGFGAVAAPAAIPAMTDMTASSLPLKPLVSTISGLDMETEDSCATEISDTDWIKSRLKRLKQSLSEYLDASTNIKATDVRDPILQNSIMGLRSVSVPHKLHMYGRISNDRYRQEQIDRVLREIADCTAGLKTGKRSKRTVSTKGYL